MIASRKKTAIFVGLVVLTILPWLQKVAAAVLAMALKKITGIDLEVIMPWLF